MSPRSVPPQLAGAYMRENIAEAIAVATPTQQPQPLGQPPGPPGPGAPPPQGALGSPGPAAPGPPALGGLGQAGPPLPAKPGMTMPMQLAMNQAAPPMAAKLQGPRGIEAQINKPVGFARGGFVVKR